MRGKCFELSKKLSEKEGYELLKGFYYEPFWNRKEQHWWCIDNEGRIHDPTKEQFPSKGIHEFYEEFDGFLDCSECGKRFKEENMKILGNGNYFLCSDVCALKFVGL